ncbi:UDP-N-acetylmuramoyl-tripeptide--D-alanyl-D-alanine ligase [Candidatus Riflebacteria bacterium]
MNLTIKQLAEILKGKLSGKQNTSFSGFSIDSRTLTSGNIFLTLKGDRFDGHNFVNDAIARGAAGIICEKKLDIKSPFIQVKSCQDALFKLAQYHRNTLKSFFIAITGSNGKTTTKTLLAKIMGLTAPTFASPGNYNNHIGVPLSLLKIETSHKFSVLELGMNDFGEISFLKNIVKPHAAIITNIGYSHLEKLKNLEGVARGKKELLWNPFAPKEVYLPKDDDFFDFLKTKIEGEVISFGTSPEADLRLASAKTSNTGTALKIHYSGKTFSFKTRLRGKIFIKNLLPVLAFCLHHKIAVEVIQNALSVFEPLDDRGRVESFQKKQIKIIKDFYNSNPSSLIESVDLLSLYRGYVKIAVIGDMLELGDMESDCHRDIGRAMSRKPVDFLFTFGNASEIISGVFNSSKKREIKARHFYDIKKLFQALKNLIKSISQPKVVLIKGSRGMKMERLFHLLQSLFEHSADR